MSTNKRVAILVHDGYQDLQFWYPLLRLREEGVAVTVVSVESEKTYFSQLEYAAAVLGGAAADALPCERLASLALPDATITRAAIVAPGQFSAPGGRAGRADAAFEKLPAFCRAFFEALKK